MAENKFTQPIAQIKQGISEIEAQITSIDTKLIKVAEKAKTIGTSFKANTPDGLSDILKQQNDLLQKMNGLLDAQTNNTKKLNSAKKDLNKLTLQESITKKESLKSLKIQATANNKLISVYSKLMAQRKQMRAELDRLNVTLGKNHEKTKRLQKAYDKVSQSTTRANKGFLLLTKGGIKGAVTGIGKLLSAFGVVGGVSLFTTIAKDIFNLTKQLESLGFALKTVTDTQAEFIKVNKFLSDISDRYGQSIITTTERYTKFLAAAKQSNVSLTDTEQIFESVTKASGVLGLKTDELTGVYLALEQMLSKGKVTTEELRRQLGERLPGAFGIMAEALGVTVSQLDDMLKKGEILSSEALPKFAEQLEKAYGIENVTRIDTLVAAQNRLQNQWIEFVDVLTNGDTIIKSTFAGTLNFLSTVLSSIKQLAEEIKDAFTSEETKARLKEESAFAAKQQEQIDALNTIVSTQQRYNAALKEAFDLQDNLSSKLQADGSFTKEQADETSKSLVRLIANTRSYSEFLEKSTQIVERDDLVSKSYLATLYARISGINTVIDSIENQTGAEESLTDEKEKGIEAIKGSIAFLENLIKKLEEEQSKLATNSKQYALYTSQINEAKDALKSLRLALGADVSGSASFLQNRISELEEERGKLVNNREEYARYTKEIAILQNQLALLTGEFTSLTNAVDTAASAFGALEISPEFQEELRNGFHKKQIEEAKKELEEYRETLKSIFNSSFGTFADTFDFDMASLDFVFDSLEDESNKLFSRDKVDEWANFSREAIYSVLDASLQRYQIELQEAQRARDLIVQNDLATEKEKRLAREKFEEEERRIKTKQAKAERRNTLIKIATDTATGIVSALAQIPKFDFGISATAFAAFIAASGAAQAALVASQPLPKFAEGTKAPLNQDTLAWTGDGGRKEAVTKNGKLLGVTPDKPTLSWLPKGAEVQKDASQWINEAVYNMNMSSQGEALNSFIADNILHDELRKMREESTRTWGEVKRLAKRPIQVKNNVKVELPKKYKI